MAQYLTLEDLRLVRHPEAVLSLFRKLGNHVEPDLVALDPVELEFPSGVGIQRLFLLWPTTTSCKFSSSSWIALRIP